MAHNKSLPGPTPEPAANLAGLVQACKDEPDDDGLRLILADYLEDHGEPERAELVRIGVQIGRAGGPPASHPRLHAQLVQLRRAHDSRWLTEFPTGTFPVWHRRGFHHFRCSGSEQGSLLSCLRHLGLETWTEGISISETQRESSTFLLEDALVRLSPSLSLTLVDTAERHILALAQKPHAAGLRDLTLNLENLPYGAFPVEQAQHLASASFTPHLRSLSIRSHDLTSTHLAGFASGAFENLRSLCLREGRVSNFEIPAGLRELRLESSGLSSLGVEAIARSPRSASLEVLTVQGYGLTAGALHRLANSPHLKNLKRLHLGDYDMETSGIHALADTHNLKALVALDLNLRHGRFESNDLLPLFESRRLPALTDLTLRGAQIQGRILEALLDGPLAPQLRRLNLDENPLGSEGAVRLARCSALKNLETLELNHCGVGDRGLTALAKSWTLDQLLWLGVATREAIDSGLDVLSEGGGLPELKFLRVGDWERRRAGRSAFDNVRGSALRENLIDVESLDSLFGPGLD